MRSIKLKLFISYTITIFLVLLLLFGVTLYFFDKNKDNSTFEKMDDTYVSIEELIFKEKNIDISTIDKDLDLRNQFLIIFLDNKVVFTNQSQFKTQSIIDEIIYDKRHEHEDDEDRRVHIKDELEEIGYAEVDDYIFSLNYVQKDDKEYEIYLGIDEKFIDDSISAIYNTIILLVIVIFAVLTLLGYLLINKTINPLKVILKELDSLQDTQDLSKRLLELNTRDEFEQLTKTFNKMLTNIENSVENIKQFSSDASHELRTPLTVIQGEIELIKNKKASKEELELVIEKIDKEQKKLQEIIKNFLLLSRLDKEVLKEQSSSLDKVVFECIESNLEEIEAKNLELDLQIDENLEVAFDEKYLNIVINNLLTNAIKYTKEGKITLKAKKESNKTYFEISDTGIGIDKNDLDKIYERFYRVDKARTTSKDGIGLGLSIVRKICERFKTKINVKSQIDKGSTFILLFT